MHVYCPPPRHLRPQIATSPADHLVDCRIGTRQNQIAQLRHLLLRQKRRTTRALAGLQTTNPLDVVTVNPVAQRLPVHPVQFRRRLARPSFHHQRQGQQTADLRAVARFGRSRPQRRRIMLRPRDCHCRAHAPSPCESMVAAIESEAETFAYPGGSTSTRAGISWRRAAKERQTILKDLLTGRKVVTAYPDEYLQTIV